MQLKKYLWFKILSYLFFWVFGSIRNIFILFEKWFFSFYFEPFYRQNFVSAECYLLAKKQQKPEIFADNHKFTQLNTVFIARNIIFISFAPILEVWYIFLRQLNQFINILCTYNSKSNIILSPKWWWENDNHCNSYSTFKDQTLYVNKLHFFLDIKLHALPLRLLHYAPNLQ